METTDHANTTDYQLNKNRDILIKAESCAKDKTFTLIMNVVLNIGFIPAIFGNVLVIVTYMKFDFRGKAMYKFIFNMAVSDLMLGFVMLFYPIEVLVPEIAHYKYVCTARFAGMLWSIAVSGSFLSVISTDRFLAVVTPLKLLVGSQNKRLIWIVITVIWLSTFCFGIFVIFSNQLKDYGLYDTQLPCVKDAILSEITQYVIDIVIISGIFYEIVCYVVVITTLNKSFSIGKNVSNVVSKTKLMIIVNATFIICWLPMVISELVFLANKDTASDLTICMRSYLALIGLIQPCTNWIYYGLWNSRFRNGFKTILCCRRGART